MGTGLKIVFFSLIFVFTSFVFAGDYITKANNEKEEVKEEVLDIIHVHGMILKGKITNIDSTTLSFRLVNIDGINRIPIKDIEAIHTKYKYNIYDGSKKISGKVVGIVNQESLKVSSNGKTTLIKIDDIGHFAMSTEDDPSTENYVNNTLPYTSGNLHVGVEVESGSSIKRKTDINTNITRKKGQNEGYLHFAYSYETTETSTTPEVVNKDELSLALGNRYYYDPDNFFFGGVLGEYDRPRNIDSRLVPNAGYGHNFKLGKDGSIKPHIGLAYVLTKYTEDDVYPDSSYTAASLGITGKYQFNDVRFIETLIVDGRYIFYPSLENLGEEWISRANLGLTVPLYEFLTTRLDFVWINDSNPDPTIGNNKTQTNLMFGVDF